MIREATDSDLPEILRMGKAFVDVSGFSVPFDSLTAKHFVTGAINSDQAVILVAESGYGLCGMIVLAEFPHFFNQSVKAAQEFCWWIDPPMRGKRIALQLLNAAEQWATDRGCKTLHMLALDKLNGAEVASMYQRRGYEPLERTFVRTL